MGQVKLTVRCIVFTTILFLWIRDTAVFSLGISNFNPNSLEIQWQLIKNNHPNKNQFLAALNFKNNSEYPLPSTGWKILFNLRYHGHTLSSVSPSLGITHVSGELFAIQPKGEFAGLAPGQSVVMHYTGNRLVANYQDVPSGLIWVSSSDKNAGIDLAPVKIIDDPDEMHESLPSAEAAVLFNENKAVDDIPIDALPGIFPTPANYKASAGTFALDPTVQIVADQKFLREAEYLSRELSSIFEKEFAVNTLKKTKTIFLRSSNLSPEAYRLKVQTDQILIEAGDPAGIFYGIQSLKSLFPPEIYQGTPQTMNLRTVEVNDTPRFPFRAFMLDVARNFQPKEEILKVLELMSLYKLNVFHFHLNDDEGWRLEIPGLPELTTVGASRGYPFENNYQLHPSYGSGVDGKRTQGSGFYSREDYIDILKYATARHIRVVPEIEAPGHARAAIKSMHHRFEKYMKQGNAGEANRYRLHDPDDASVYMSNQYFNDNVMNVALPSTYTFIEKVIEEIKDMYQESGAPLPAIHMAGDEVPHGSWERSPAVIAFMRDHGEIKSGKDLWKYYFNEIKKICKKKGLSIYGWQELVVGTQTADDSKHVIDPGFLADDVQLDAWWNLYGNEDVPYKLANAGYKTVLTCFDYFYFDLAYQNSFEEPGDGWIGFLDVDKTFSFVPYDYYRNAKTDIRGALLPPDFFKGKEKLTEAGKKNIVGIQGALWGENLVSAELMEYLLMPKLMALAERAWAPDPAWANEPNPDKAEDLYNKAWSVFVNTIGKRELPKLDFYHGGFGYRIPTPGAIVTQGKVSANMQLPGFTIRYTTDGTKPIATSKRYTTPIAEKGTIKLSAFDGRGRAGKAISIYNP